MPRTLATLVAAAVLVACGGGEPREGQPAGSAQQRIAKAAVATRGVDSYRFNVKTTVDNPKVLLTGEGTFDLDGKRSATKVDLEEGGVFGIRAAREQIEMVSDASVIYVSAPGLEGFDSPTPWVRMDLRKLRGPEFKELAQLVATDPTRHLDMLRGVATDAEVVGTEDIREVPTTHYRLTINMPKAISHAPKISKGLLRQLVTEAQSNDIPSDVWVDDEGLVRRMEITIDASNVFGATGGGAPPPMLKSAVEMYDFGAKVNIRRPRKALTTDVFDLRP